MGLTSLLTRPESHAFEVKRLKGGELYPVPLDGIVGPGETPSMDTGKKSLKCASMVLY